MNMHHIIVDCVRFVVHDVVRVVLVQLHLQVAIDQRLARAYLDIYLVSFLSLDIATGDKDFG